MVKPEVSIIVNCLNGEKYLPEALDSVFKQTWSNWEIVFWDNCSTDSSREIAMSFGPRIRYFRSERTYSLGKARNLAVEQAVGNYICFLDCDDVWLPDRLRLQVLRMQQREFGLCYAGIIKIDERGKELGTYIPRPRCGNVLGEILTNYDVHQTGVMVNAGVLRRNGLLFDEQMVASEDYCLFMQLAVVSEFCVLDNVVARYRIHDGALTNRTIDNWASERIYTLDLICRCHPGIEQRYRREFREAYARANYYRARSLIQKGERRAAIQELLKVALVNHRYLALFLLSLFPSVVWNRVHWSMTHRRNYQT